MSKLPSEYLELYWVPYAPIKDDEQCLLSAFGMLGDYHDKIGVILQELIGYQYPSVWNDTHTKQEVLAVARLVEMKLGLRPIETETEEAEVVSIA